MSIPLTGLPTSYCRAERIAVRQGRALQYAASGRGRAACPPGGEEPHDRQEDAEHARSSAGSQSHAGRASRTEGPHGHQGPQDQRSAAEGMIERYSVNHYYKLTQ